MPTLLIQDHPGHVYWFSGFTGMRDDAGALACQMEIILNTVVSVNNSASRLRPIRNRVGALRIMMSLRITPAY